MRLIRHTYPSGHGSDFSGPKWHALLFLSSWLSLGRQKRTTNMNSYTRASLFRRLGIHDIDSYFHNQVLRWAGHVARMPMSRAPPRQLLTGWISNSRPIDCPLGAGRWRTRSLVRAFPRSLVSGSPLPWTGRSGGFSEGQHKGIGFFCSLNSRDSA